MSHLLQGPTLALELDYEKQTAGNKTWHESYNYPYWGVAGFYYDHGNPDVLGQTFGCLPYLNFHLVRRQSFEITLRTGIGLSYSTKKFDIDENHKNLAIGSHFNATIDFMIGVRKTWGRSTVTAGIEFMHHSNGAIYLPNLGINTPTLNLGYGYKLSKDENRHVKPKTPYLSSNKWAYQILGIASVKQEYPLGTAHYGVGSIGLSAIKMFTQKSGLMLRLDWIYNNAHQRNISSFSKSNFSQIWQSGVSANYYLAVDRLKILLGMGVYLKNSLNPDGYIYSRAGFQYQWSNGWVANLAIKSHYARADYVEFGIGYTLLR